MIIVTQVAIFLNVDQPHFRWSSSLSQDGRRQVDLAGSKVSIRVGGAENRIEGLEGWSIVDRDLLEYTVCEKNQWKWSNICCNLHQMYLNLNNRVLNATHYHNFAHWSTMINHNFGIQLVQPSTYWGLEYWWGNFWDFAQKLSWTLPGEEFQRNFGVNFENGGNSIGI